jgi:hypothetical protein
VGGKQGELNDHNGGGSLAGCARGGDCHICHEVVAVGHARRVAVGHIAPLSISVGVPVVAGNLGLVAVSAGVSSSFFFNQATSISISKWLISIES